MPELVAFNVWIAAPIPLAALGMYLFLRRSVGGPAAAFGAIAGLAGRETEANVRGIAGGLRPARRRG